MANVPLIANQIGSKTQIVHKRILINDATSVAPIHAFQAYGPFGYGVPSVQTGATRKFRLYAVYSDNDTQNSILVAFEPMGSSVNYGNYGGAGGPEYGLYNFYLPYTWGDSATFRDGYSNELTGSPGGDHMFIRCGTYNGSTNVKFLYLELQVLDVFP